MNWLVPVIIVTICWLDMVSGPLHDCEVGTGAEYFSQAIRSLMLVGLDTVFLSPS